MVSVGILIYIASIHNIKNYEKNKNNEEAVKYVREKDSMAKKDLCLYDYAHTKYQNLAKLQPTLYRSALSSTIFGCLVLVLLNVLVFMRDLDLVFFVLADIFIVVGIMFIWMLHFMNRFQAMLFKRYLMEHPIAE